MLTTEDQKRFDELIAEMKAAGGYRFLNKAQRAEYKALKDKNESEEEIVISAAPIPPEDIPEKSFIMPSNLNIKDKLMNVWGEMKDADERGKLANMMNDPYILALPEDQLFEQIFNMLRDGNDRAVLRKHFNKT